MLALPALLYQYDLRRRRLALQHLAVHALDRLRARGAALRGRDGGVAKKEYKDGEHSGQNELREMRDIEIGLRNGRNFVEESVDQLNRIAAAK